MKQWVVREGEAVAETSKVESIFEQRFCRWKNQNAGMDERSLKRFKGLECESIQIKKLVAEQALDLRILKGGKMMSPDRRRQAAEQV